jgi:GDP-L-fucose synthase
VKIFVTGATGFLGRNLLPVLQQKGYEVTGVGSTECNLLERESLDRFRRFYDQVWHLASWTQAGDFCKHHQGEQWIINQRINTNVLDWWHSRQPQAKLVAIGTSCSYAEAGELVEDNYLAGDPVPELYSYAMTKRMLLIGMRALAAQYNLAYLYLIPSTLFGPGYHVDGKQLHFIFDIMRKIVHGKIHDEPVRLWGDGFQKRELISVKDFVNAAVRLASTTVNQIVNVGSGEEFSIRWYAEKICSLTGYDPQRIEYDTSQYTGVRSKKLSVAKLRSLVPEFQLTPIHSTLEETLRWYECHLRSPLEKA